MDEHQRASEVFDIPLGAVFETYDPWRRLTQTYIFVGWAVNTVGKEAVFVLSYNGLSVSRPFSPWTYVCARAETMLWKFPDAARYLRDDATLPTARTGTASPNGDQP